MKKKNILKTLGVGALCLTGALAFSACGPTEETEKELTKYNIQYELNGGTNSYNNPIQYDEKTTTITLANPTREGYTFLGWYTDENFENEITAIEIGSKEDLTLYAKWEVNQYTISFNSNGGTAVNSITENYGVEVSAPNNPTRDGYVFAGWYYDEYFNSQFTFSTMPASNLTLYARFEAIFNLSGGVITGLTNYAKNRVENIVIPDQIDGVDIVEIAEGAFRSTSIKEVVIGSKVTIIDNFAFGRCNRLQEIIIPDNVLTLGTGILYQCTGLTSVTVGDGVTTLTEGFCSGCSKLEQVTLGTGIQKIDKVAFSSCGNLININLPDSVQTIEVGAFGECPKLETITLDAGVKNIYNEAFLNDSKLNAINFPNGLLTIGDKVFKGCTSLTSISIPSSTTSIGDYAFASCSNLEIVDISSGVRTIGANAFDSCSNLKYIYIPSTVTTISSTRTLNGTAQTKVLYSPFYGCSRYSLKIYCEATSKPQGYDAYWNIIDYGTSINQVIAATTTFNVSRETFENTAYPYRATVNQINNDENFAKETFNQIISNTVAGNATINYEDGTVYTFNNTNKYLYWTTDSTEYLSLYDVTNNVVYEAHYTSSDSLNNFGYILPIDLTNAEEEGFEFDIKNHLHVIFEVSQITAVEGKDFYTLQVTYQEIPFAINYKIKNNKIAEIYIDWGEEDETITIAYNDSMENLTFVSEPFTVLNRMRIDSDFLDDLTLLDFTYLTNIETIIIDRNQELSEYITNNFEFEEFDGNQAIYSKK